MAASTAGFCRNGHDLAVVGCYSNRVCRECQKAQSRINRQSPASRERERLRSQRRNPTPEARAARKRWAQSPRGRENIRARARAYNLSERGRMIRDAYAASIRGQIVRKLGETNYRIKQKQARIAELERELQYANT